jgi:dolichol-phosphate mannosyltransferase
MKKKLITIICPVYNEEITIPLFYNKINEIINRLQKYDFKILFTNNNSQDDSLKVISNLSKKDKRISYLTFSKNFGYQASLVGGLTHAKGDAFIFIDVDCEDPPNMIFDFIKNWENGFDIVYGLRDKRAEPTLITFFRKLFYRILHFLADTEIILDMAEFSLISNRVKKEITNNSNTFPFLRAEIAYSGFKKIGIKYDRQPRIAGKSNYNLWRMALFGLGGILSVSTFPLRLGILFLPVLVLINFILLILDLIFNINKSISILIFLNLMFIITLVSFQGIYIARIYKNSISRPVFIVDWMQSKLN